MSDNINKKIKSNKSTTIKKTAKKIAIKKIVTVTLIKSLYGRLPKHRQTIKGLGLKTINNTVQLEDTSAIRGMINKVSYLLKIES